MTVAAGDYSKDAFYRTVYVDTLSDTDDNEGQEDYKVQITDNYSGSKTVNYYKTEVNGYIDDVTTKKDIVVNIDNAVAPEGQNAWHGHRSNLEFSREISKTSA